MLEAHKDAMDLYTWNDDGELIAIDGMNLFTGEHADDYDRLNPFDEIGGEPIK
jgi:hypothetical protein